MTYCHVSAQIAAHAEAEGRAAAWQDAIYQRTDELLQPGGECDPLDANNFGEAMAGADFAEVVALYRSGDDLAAGFAVRQIAENYWQERAPVLAEERLEEEIEAAKEDAAADAAADALYY